MWRATFGYVFVVLLISSGSPLLFEYGWNHGVVDAASWARPIGYWQAVYVESAILLGAFVGQLMQLATKGYMFLVKQDALRAMELAMAAQHALNQIDQATQSQPEQGS